MIRSKLAIATIATAALAAHELSAQRQEPSQEELIERRAEKLGKPFLTKAKWFTDYDEARAAAKEQGRFLFTYFTRSYSP